VQGHHAMSPHAGLLSGVLAPVAPLQEVRTDQPLPACPWLRPASVSRHVTGTCPTGRCGDMSSRCGDICGDMSVSAGFNPMNAMYTTGLGHDWPHHPLHLDSRRSGQPAPRASRCTASSTSSSRCTARATTSTGRSAGTCSGPARRRRGSAPAYCDIFLWPPVCEYTIHQTLGSTAYVWGSLAARRRRCKDGNPPPGRSPMTGCAGSGVEGAGRPTAQRLDRCTLPHDSRCGPLASPAG
jgi:hypothetical protein